MTEYIVDIIERIEAFAEETEKRDRLYGMSTARMFHEAKEEIIRLREELKREMCKTHLATLRSRRY